MSSGADVADRVASLLWPYLEQVVGTWELPGLAVAVVHDGDRVAARGFGSRDVATGEPVTEETLFHLASVSKTVVATAVLQLVGRGELDLDAGVTAYLPDLPWADPRAERVTLRHLLSHTSGLGDVSDYGWHEPELDDGALGRFAARVAGWTLEADPGARFSYSNAAYELLGHLVATVGGRPFEDHVRTQVLEPAGMTTSTFRLAEVPPHLGAGPHLGLPPRVVDGVYPYTRRHAPSSTLHSSAAELGRWMVAHLAGGGGVLPPATHRAMWEPQAATGWRFYRQMALGWFQGRHGDHVVVGHSGDDPGFESSMALAPELGVGVAVLANSNLAPMLELTRAALDVLAGREPAAVPPPPVTVALGPVLDASGLEAAATLHAAIAARDPATHDLDDGAFEDALWGAVEMHRPDLVRPALELWRQLHPRSSSAWVMTGWAEEVEGRRGSALEHLRHAVALDPDDDEATRMLARLSAGREG